MEPQIGYDRIEVIVSGRELLTARPIEFEQDDEGNNLSVFKYETTCPLCGSMVQFHPHEVDVVGDKKYINCACMGTKKVNYSAVKLQRPSIEVVNKRIIPQKKVEIDRGCPFVDPIELAIFDPTKADYDNVIPEQPLSPEL